MSSPPRDQPSLLARISRHSLTRFAVLGGLGLAFDVSLLGLLLTFTPLPDAAALTLAFATTYLLNFFLNRRFAFGAQGHLGQQLVRFAPQVGIDYLLTISAVEIFTRVGLALLTARILAGGTNAAFNYSMYRWWVFVTPSRPRAEPDAEHHRPADPDRAARSSDPSRAAGSARPLPHR